MIFHNREGRCLLSKIAQSACRTAINIASDDIFSDSPFEDSTIALVTGGSNGFGLELVLKLVSHDIKVIIADLTSPSIQFSSNNKVSFYHCDITDYDQIMSLHRKIRAEHGIVTMLFNNAGITRIAPLEATSDTDIRKVIDVNYIGAYMMIQTFLPDMLECGKGYIINISSILGVVTPARLTSYGASKGGLIALHKSMRQNWRHKQESSDQNKNIKMLLVCPGKIKTSMFESVKTPSTLIAPDIEPRKLASYIVSAIEHSVTTTITFPYYTNLVPLFKKLSWPYLCILKRLSGMDAATAI